MDLEEITKLVDGIYKNILDKFNPGARQLITAGKAYLKALHGAAAASRVYVDAINKLAKQAQQGTWGASSDIGSALMQIVDVYKEIQAQQMNILKAFYVDLLVPLETNLEKDTKVVQSEQKRFLAQHKQRSESYSKAAAAIKKQRKKTRAKPGIALDREVKSLQTLEEERVKLDAFCESSLKTAMTQERRRYGFVLERQCSLAKHYLLHHTECRQALEGRLDAWQEASQSRETLPEGVEAVMAARLRQVNFWSDETTPGGGGASPDDDHVSMASQLRKTKSMDASCLDMRSIGDVAADEDLGGCVQASPVKPLSRAKSEFDLSASTQSLVQEPEPRPKSMAVSSDSGDTPLARAMHAYLSSGDNQLSFLEGDVIALMGERIKGWQFGENLRTQSSGWFPLAYTEVLMDMTDSSPTHGTSTISQIATSPSRKSGNSGKRMDAGHNNKGDHSRPATRQGNYSHQHRAGRHQGRPGPPPLVPAPVPRRLPPASSGVAVNGGGGGGATTLKAAAGTSLHSSNDSGFSNEPPPLPEADYSDDDSSSEKTVTPANSGPVSSRLSKIQQNRASAPGGSSSGWGSTTTTPRTITTEPRRRPENINNGGDSSSGKKMTNGHHHNMSSLSRLGLLDEGRKPSIPVKRTKSLWKFRRGEQPGDILEGMSLWRHRSLVDVPAAVEAAASEERRTKPEVAVQTDLDSEEDEDDVDQDSGSESCIVVEDHRRAPTEPAPLLPPPPPPSGPAPTPAKVQQQQIPVPAGRQRNGIKHKKMSLVSNQGKGSVSMPWYRLWGLDPVSVN